MLATHLTREWGLQHPIVQAPMAGVSGGELARAVSAAGGLGFVPVGPRTDPDSVLAQAEIAREGGRFGVGLMAWSIDRRPEQLEAALEARPFAVSISFGDPAPYVPAAHEAGALVVSQVQDRESAREAIDAGVDALVAQGSEAGGHTRADVATLPLLQVVLELAEEPGLPVLAAGGLATGRALAGVIAMGAAGAWIGTRFAATAEAAGRPAAKERIVRSTESDTVLTRVFDITQRIPWPERFPGRALRNAFTDRWHGQEDALGREFDAAGDELERARAEEDYDSMYVYAGQAVGAIHDLPPAGELVRRLAGEAERSLRRACG